MVRATVWTAGAEDGEAPDGEVPDEAREEAAPAAEDVEEEPPGTEEDGAPDEDETEEDETAEEDGTDDEAAETPAAFLQPESSSASVRASPSAAAAIRGILFCTGVPPSGNRTFYLYGIFSSD